MIYCRIARPSKCNCGVTFTVGQFTAELFHVTLILGQLCPLSCTLREMRIYLPVIRAVVCAVAATVVVATNDDGCETYKNYWLIEFSRQQ